jgi:hypothetical protein
MNKLIKFLVVLSMITTAFAGDRDEYMSRRDGQTNGHGNDRHTTVQHRDNDRRPVYTNHRNDDNKRRPIYRYERNHHRHRPVHVYKQRRCDNRDWERVAVFGVGVITGAIIHEVIRPEPQVIIVEKRVPVYTETVIIRKTTTPEW